MYGAMKDQAVALVQRAVQEDDAGDYAAALQHYVHALEYFAAHLRYERNPKVRDAIAARLPGYVSRAEEIRALLDGQAAPGGCGGGGQEGWPEEEGRRRRRCRRRGRRALRGEGQAPRGSPLGDRLREAQREVGRRRRARRRQAGAAGGRRAPRQVPAVLHREAEALEGVSPVRAAGDGEVLPGQSRRDGGRLHILQGVGHNDDKVLVLAATNTPYALDQAVRRRFDKRIYIPLPDLKARQRMFKVHLGDTPHSLSEGDFESLARRTDGFSGSDVAVCVKDVLFEPVRKTQDAMFFFMSDDGNTWMPCGSKQQGAVQTTMEELAAEGMADKITPPPISRTDFEKVLARQRPTVSKAELEVYTRFTREFGEEG